MTVDEVRELLVLNGWTREDLAAKFGITRNTVDRWFCAGAPHRRYPTAEQAEKMRRWLREAITAKYRQLQTA